MMCLGAWSSGMIRASGARGRGFDSHSSPSHVAHVAARAASRGTRSNAQANEPGARECLEENEGAAVSAEEGAHADGPRGHPAPGMGPGLLRGGGRRRLPRPIFGEIVERPLDAFSNWGAIELADENELAIPQHRVVYFKSGDMIVWDKRRIYDVDGMSCRLDASTGARARQDRPVGDRGAAARVAAQSRMIDPHLTTTGRPQSR